MFYVAHLFPQTLWVKVLVCVLGLTVSTLSTPSLPEGEPNKKFSNKLPSTTQAIMWDLLVELGLRAWQSENWVTMQNTEVVG